jgi:amino acid adenylation domain-containing protein
MYDCPALISSQCLAQLFEAQVARSPEAVAVVCEDQHLTYQELNERANQLAHYLRRCGVGPETLVGLYVPRGLAMIVGLLGILKAGGAYVPLDPASPQERLAFLLEDSQPALVVTQQPLQAHLPVNRYPCVSLDADQPYLAEQPCSNPTPTATPATLAYVIYTSGSTGKPKGTLVTHGNVTRLFRATEAWYRFQARDVWTLFHSIAFDFSVWELWGALLYGGRLVVVPYAVSRTPTAFYDLLLRERVTVLNQTPSAFYQLMEFERASQVRGELALRLVIFGGEALDVARLQPWFARHGDQCPRLVNMYGITETTVHVTYRPLSEADTSAGLGSVIGVPIPDLRVHILNQDLQPVSLGEAGELYVGGAGLARGYLNRPDLTAERFLSDPFVPGDRLYKTGDLARRLPTGELVYLGRNDQQVKLRGFRIELGEIETALCQLPGVRNTVVTLREDVPGEKRLVAYLVPVPRASLSARAVREHLAAQLPDYMLPAAFVLLEALPLTLNGKLDRAALPAPSAANTLWDEASVAPRTPTEEYLVQLWAAVLGVERVGVEDNFSALGGQSLQAVRMLTRINAAFRVNLPFSSLFARPTVAMLAAEIDQLLEPEMAPVNSIPA